jgi:hypothetical protein
VAYSSSYSYTCHQIEVSLSLLCPAALPSGREHPVTTDQEAVFRGDEGDRSRFTSSAVGAQIVRHVACPKDDKSCNFRNVGL